MSLNKAKIHYKVPHCNSLWINICEVPHNEKFKFKKKKKRIQFSIVKTRLQSLLKSEQMYHMSACIQTTAVCFCFGQMSN